MLKADRTYFCNNNPGTNQKQVSKGPEISPDLLRFSGTVWEKTGVIVSQIGDVILNCAFHTKLNTMGSEVIEGLNKAIDLAEKDFRGMVIANDGREFSAGANLEIGSASCRERVCQ